MSAAGSAGRRAARNTILRAAGEIVGKLASLILFAALGRSVGESDLGVFVLAFAFLQIAIMPVDLGFDGYVTKAVSARKDAADELLADVVALKLALCVPIVAFAYLFLGLAGYDQIVREAIFVLTLGLLADSFARTIFGVFIAHERSGLLSACVVLQRVGAAALGLGALALGYGVITVAATYTVGALAGLALAVVLLLRLIGRPPLRISPRRWPGLLRGSFPFALQDVFTVAIFRVDAVLLSLLATNAAVGRYGAAYRLLEATFFLTYSLDGAFQAMYTYLTRESEPTVGAVFQRSIKLALALLAPIAVAFAVEADPICALLVGEGLADAGGPLRILAPVVLLLGIVTLASTLLISRTRPIVVVWLTAGALVLNVGLNAVLIPELADEGAATAMLVTELALAVAVLVLAARNVGGLSLLPTFTPAAVAAAAMAGAMLALAAPLGWSLAAGGVVYALVLAGLERWLSPEDFRFVSKLVRRRVAAS